MCVYCSGGTRVGLVVIILAAAAEKLFDELHLLRNALQPDLSIINGCLGAGGLATVYFCGYLGTQLVH